jgi:hypothetical protein
LEATRETRRKSNKIQTEREKVIRMDKLQEAREQLAKEQAEREQVAARLADDRQAAMAALLEKHRDEKRAQIAKQAAENEERLAATAEKTKTQFRTKFLSAGGAPKDFEDAFKEFVLREASGAMQSAKLPAQKSIAKL